MFLVSILAEICLFWVLLACFFILSTCKGSGVGIFIIYLGFLFFLFLPRQRLSNFLTVQGFVRFDLVLSRGLVYLFFFVLSLFSSLHEVYGDVWHRLIDGGGVYWLVDGASFFTESGTGLRMWELLI